MDVLDEGDAAKVEEEAGDGQLDDSPGAQDDTGCGGFEAAERHYRLQQAVPWEKYVGIYVGDD